MVDETLKCGIDVATVGDRYFDEEVGQRLKTARLKAGWTQNQIAELLGLSFQQVQKYETGINRLPANKYPKLAASIGFDVTDLLKGKADSFEKSAPIRDADQVLVFFEKMSQSQRNQIISLCAELARK